MEISTLPARQWIPVAELMPPADPHKYAGSIDVIVKDDAGMTALAYYDFDQDDFCCSLNQPKYWKMAEPGEVPDLPSYEA